MTRRRWWAALTVVVLLVTAACTEAKPPNDDGLGDPGDCIIVEMASSPEKIDLMTALAKTFNDSDRAKLGGECIFVRPQKKSSGAALNMSREVWSPTSSHAFFGLSSIACESLTQSLDSHSVSSASPWLKSC